MKKASAARTPWPYGLYMKTPLDRRLELSIEQFGAYFKGLYRRILNGRITSTSTF